MGRKPAAVPHGGLQPDYKSPTRSQPPEPKCLCLARQPALSAFISSPHVDEGGFPLRTVVMPLNANGASGGCPPQSLAGNFLRARPLDPAPLLALQSECDHSAAALPVPPCQHHSCLCTLPAPWGSAKIAIPPPARGTRGGLTPCSCLWPCSTDASTSQPC